MRGLLRTIAVLEGLAAAVTVLLLVFGLGLLPPGRPQGALALVLVAGGFAAATGFAGLQLWRLREVGRVSTVVVLIALMLFSVFQLFVRGQPYVAVRLVLEGAALAALLSRGAREVCA
jgi:hypothetical protein